MTKEHEHELEATCDHVKFRMKYSEIEDRLIRDEVLGVTPYNEIQCSCGANFVANRTAAEEHMKRVKEEWAHCTECDSVVEHKCYVTDCGSVLCSDCAVQGDHKIMNGVDQPLNKTKDEIVEEVFPSISTEGPEEEPI